MRASTEPLCITSRTSRKPKSASIWKPNKGLPRFLDQNGLPRLAEAFRELELLRQGRWYGGKENGGVSKEVLSILERIKQEGRP